MTIKIPPWWKSSNFITKVWPKHVLFKLFLLFYTQHNPLSVTLLSASMTPYTECILDLLNTRVPISHIADIVSLSCVTRNFLSLRLFSLFQIWNGRRFMPSVTPKENLFWYRNILPPGLLLPSYSSLATEEVNSSLDKKLCFVENQHSLEDWTRWVKFTNSHPHPLQEPFYRKTPTHTQVSKMVSSWKLSTEIVCTILSILRMPRFSNLTTSCFVY
jgi:hypothetical protein